MTETNLQLYDTGMETKGGSVVYDRAHTDWINLNASSIRPEWDFIGTNNEAKRFNDSHTRFTFEPNSIESMNPPRLTVQCHFPVSDLSDYQRLLNMGYTLGLKKIKGGLGTLANMSESSSGEVYVIIKSFRASETLTTTNSHISITITFEVV